MTRTAHWLIALAMVAVITAPSVAQTPGGGDAPYVQHENIVYHETDGIGLLMDAFVPKGDKNGLALVDVASGGWSSDRGKIEDHKRAQMFDQMCGRGYTVFAVRPGSSSKFSALEMLANLKQGIRWVKAHKDEYGIDADRLGLAGASAGGHLACLAAVTGDDGNPESKKTFEQQSTRVKAVVAFFPPTDFLDWGGIKMDLKKGGGPLAAVLGRVMFPGGIRDQTPEEIAEAATKISPARLVTSQAPPFLLIHGDADPLVPLQQSKRMLECLQTAGVPCELIVKKGGGHPWPTIHEEVKVAADWLDKQLAAAGN